LGLNKPTLAEIGRVVKQVKNTKARRRKGTSMADVDFKGSGIEDIGVIRFVPAAGLMQRLVFKAGSLNDEEINIRFNVFR